MGEAKEFRDVLLVLRACIEVGRAAHPESGVTRQRLTNAEIARNVDFSGTLT